MLNSILTLCTPYLYFFAFVALAMLQLGIFFGIAYRFNRWVESRLGTWRRQPVGLKILILVPLYLAAKTIALLFIVDDWLTNLIVVTAFFFVVSGFTRCWPCGDIEYKGIPLPWLQLVTGRVQVLLYDLAAWPESFSAVEKLFLRAVVWFAHKSDDDHFTVPAEVFD